MLKKYYFFLAAILLIICLINGCQLILEKSEKEFYGQEAAREIARQWIVENSPTYKFDGFDLKFEETSLLRCPFCYQFIFSFHN